MALLARGAAYRKKKGFEKAKMNNQICRLIEKVKSVVKDELLAKLLSSFCDLPILDSSGKDWSVKTGIPPVVFISSIQKNLFIDDLDREVEVRFPNLQYARFLALLEKFHKESLHSSEELDSTLFIRGVGFYFFLFLFLILSFFFSLSKCSISFSFNL